MLVAVLDACVLYPPALRDLFMWLTASFVFQPRWTEQRRRVNAAVAAPCLFS
jgi:hypothetical protein